MNKLKCLVLFCVLLVSTAASFAAAKLDSVTIGYSSFSGDYVPLWIAIEEQVGKKYGTLKLCAHLLDWMCLGAYFFRRLVPGGEYPICSWLVADAYSAAGKHFDCDPGAATPDDIWDFVAERQPNYFVRLHPLEPLE